MRGYTIAELVSLTHVPPATVHYYLRLGLLPKPRLAAPNRFQYDDRHVRGLRLIRRLREERGLPLPLIRRILPELLALESEEAFRPELWDRALAPRVEHRRLPGPRLLEAAKQAFSRRGFADVGIDDLTHAAGIAKGSFYRHYRSKDELFVTAAGSLIAEAVSSFRTEVGPAGVQPEPAAQLLASILRPSLPVFLEVVARSLRDRPVDVGSARATVETLATGVGELITGPGTAWQRGARAVGEALVLVARAEGRLTLHPSAAADPM
jgi:AcrR family transcriptional regulator